jgi:hypothetical protein
LPRAATRIPRGENAGHTLVEFNIVRACRTLASWHGQQLSLAVPVMSLPTDASKVVVLLQHAQQKYIVGASTLSLR